MSLAVLLGLIDQQVINAVAVFHDSQFISLEGM